MKIIQTYLNDFLNDKYYSFSTVEKYRVKEK